jgi:hypothetical protein
MASRSGMGERTDWPMHPQLVNVVDCLGQAELRLEKLADSVPDDRWNVRRDPARWSVAECVAHLNLTSAAYEPLIRKAIEEARKLPPAGHRPYHRDKVGWLFSVLTGPLPALGRLRIGRVKTIPAFVPTGELPKQLTLADFKRHQLELARMVQEGDGLPLDEVSITSPFGGRIRYNCYSTFVIITRHEERHLQQAELVWQ